MSSICYELLSLPRDEYLTTFHKISLREEKYVSQVVGKRCFNINFDGFCPSSFSCLAELNIPLSRENKSLHTNVIFLVNTFKR